MLIKTLTIGNFACNNYLVVCESTKQAVMIDASGEVDTVMREIKAAGAELKYILHTHAHLDHVAGNYLLRKQTGAKALLHRDDKFLLAIFKDHLRMFGQPDSENPVIDGHVDDGQVLEVGNLNFKVIHTPGHSSGGVCYLADDVLFSGDTLFANSIGRTDLPGGSIDQLRQSIVNRLFALDGNIKVYPGHGSTTTIGHEKLNNPFFGERARSR
jgi:hydroxyacylglutathione hydrolase